jgi:ribosomal protein S18
MASDAPRFVRASANVADISPQRLHPTRLFFPRTAYAPSDLDPYKTTAAAAAGSFEEEVEVVPRAAEVGRYADYKNAPLLASFLSESGKLPLRSRTHLRAKLHRHLSRQVKIARQMAILSPTERWRSENAPDAAAVAAARAARKQHTGHGPQRGQQQHQPKQKQRPAA